MIIGKQHITDFFSMQAKPYFAIFYKGKVESGNAIDRNDKDDKDYLFEDGKRRFDEVLNFIQHGEYTLIISDAKDVTKRGACRTDFKILISDSSQNFAAAPQVHAVGSLTMDQVESKANEIAEKKFKELIDKKTLADTLEKNKELEREVKALQASSSAPINDFLKKIEPFTPHIISGLFPGAGKQANVILSGTPPDSTGEGDEQAQKLFEDFATALSEARPSDWKQVLVKLTNIIKNDKVKFEMAVNFL